MADSGNISRREAMKRTVLLAVVSASGALVAACKKDEAAKELSCTDTSALAPADVEMRTVTMKYVDKSPDPAKLCSNCQQYKAAPAPGQCGGCVVVKGPIHPGGWCQAWVVKQPS